MTPYPFIQLRNYLINPMFITMVECPVVSPGNWVEGTVALVYVYGVPIALDTYSYGILMKSLIPILHNEPAKQ